MKVVLSTDVAAAQSFCAPHGMSPALEKIYRRTLERFSAEPVEDTIAARIVPKLPTRIIVNGREFESVQEMPAPYRHFYEEMLTRVLPLERAVFTVAQTEHSNSIKRIVSLTGIAIGCAVAIVYLWMHGYYG